MIIFTGTCPPSTTSCRPSRRGGRPAGATPRTGNYLQYLPIYVYLSISKSKSIYIYLSIYLCMYLQAGYRGHGRNAPRPQPRPRPPALADGPAARQNVPGGGKDIIKDFRY